MVLVSGSGNDLNPLEKGPPVSQQTVRETTVPVSVSAPGRRFLELQFCSISWQKGSFSGLFPGPPSDVSVAMDLLPRICVGVMTNV